MLHQSSRPVTRGGAQKKHRNTKSPRTHRSVTSSRSQFATRPGQFSRQSVANRIRPPASSPSSETPQNNAPSPNQLESSATNSPSSNDSLASRLLQADSDKKTSDLSQVDFQVIAPPPQYDEPVPHLITALRQVLQHDGPVSIGKIDDTTPYIDPHSIHAAIPQPADINWDAVPPFITSSRDNSLYELADNYGVKFMGSTSSVGPILSHLHFALTEFARINVSSFSHWFSNATSTHTRASVKPAINLLRKRRNNIWGIDNAPSGDPKSNQILIDLGKSLERHLTIEWDDFNRIFVRHYDPQTGEIIPNIFSPEEAKESEAHSFLKSGAFLLRSQLDCEDPAVPSNKKVFDLKTRASMPIRLDVLNHQQYLDYRVNTRHGLFNSYEREFYDMGRSAFLKYAFQCRIGNMGGVFVAYHNTQELFGFEYIPIEKMDQIVYGNSARANLVFRHNLNLMEQVVARITKDMATPERMNGGDTIRLTSISYPKRVLFFAERVPSIDLDNPIALDEALNCKYRGYIYADWLSEDQARAALQRRGLDTSGSRPHLISRLESALCTPSVLYEPPSIDFIEQLFHENSFQLYELKTQFFSTQTKEDLNWATLRDNLDDVELKYSFKRVKLHEDHIPRYAGIYHDLLHEYALLDPPSRNPQVQVPQEAYKTLVSQARENALRKRAALIQEAEQQEERDNAAIIAAATTTTTTTTTTPGENVENKDELNELNDQISHEITSLTPTQRLELENSFIDEETDPLFQKELRLLQKQYAEEIVGSLDIAGTSVPISRADEIKMQTRRQSMSRLWEQIQTYGALNSIHDPAERRRASVTLRDDVNIQHTRRKRSS